MDRWVGLDVGGQSVKAVLTDGGGTVVARARRATGPEAGLARLQTAFGEILAEFSSHGAVQAVVGVGIAGCVGADGVLHGSPNLPQLAGLELAASLGRALRRPVAVDNDAHCHALAEGWVGAAAGESDFLLITLGSGVGSGLVLDGAIHHGNSGYGCELGHLIVVARGRRCGCGNRGCLEAYVSEVGARMQVVDGAASLRRAVQELVDRSGYGYAQAVFELAARKHDQAEELARAMLEMLGVGLASAVNLLDVTTMLIGGGIAPAVMARIDEVRTAMGASLFARDASAVRLSAASGGADAGAIGAARLAMLSR